MSKEQLSQEVITEIVRNTKQERHRPQLSNELTDNFFSGNDPKQKNSYSQSPTNSNLGMYNGGIPIKPEQIIQYERVDTAEKLKENDNTNLIDEYQDIPITPQLKEKRDLGSATFIDDNT